MNKNNDKASHLALASALQFIGGSRSEARAFFGFDGYVDSIKKAVKYRDQNGQRHFFRSIGEFGQHLITHAGKSAEFEIVQLRRKIGGNAPIMAQAAASLGIFSSCCGAVGYPETHPVFETSISGLRMLGVVDPASTDAFEFDDGKLMLGEISSFRGLGWQLAMERMAERSIDLVAELAASQLVAILNWASVEKVGGFIEGFSTLVPARCGPGQFAKKILFVDFADFSGVDATTVKNWISQLENVPCRTIVSLNLKEAQLLAFVLSGTRENDSEALCTLIGSTLSLDTIVIHDRDGAYAFNSGRVHGVASFFVENPLLSTGAGDNFNAGLAFGLLHNLAIDQSLLLGNAVASLYMQSGISPSPNDVIFMLQAANSRLLTVEER